MVHSCGCRKHPNVKSHNHFTNCYVIRSSWVDHHRGHCESCSRSDCRGGNAQRSTAAGLSPLGDKVVAFGDSGSFLTKEDIGAFGAPAAQQDDAGNVSLLAGEPLLNDSLGAHASNRTGDLQRLHTEWIQSEWRGLTKCRGTYCAVHFNRLTNCVSLIAARSVCVRSTIGLTPHSWCFPRRYVYWKSWMRYQRKWICVG